MLLQNQEEALRLGAGDEVDHVLVVAVLDVVPLQPLCAIHLLLRHKHGLVELLLQALVGEVDTELFEGVDAQDLEPKDVQDPDEPCVLAGGGRGAEARVG